MTITDPQHPTRAQLVDIDIHELLPQQEPFVMVSRLTGFDERSTATELTVAADNLFVENGRLTAAGIVEHIAQTCAARIGYVNKYILLRGIQIGYIGAIRDLQILQLPRVGEVLHTRVEVLSQVWGLMLAHAEVRVGERMVCTTEMKIAIRED